MISRDEELYWLNQPAWVINAEMENRLEAYFKRKTEERLKHEARSGKQKAAGLERSIAQLQRKLA